MQSEGGINKYVTRFFLDEFQNLFKPKIMNAPELNINYIVLVQTMSQLRMLYKTELSDFLDLFDTILILGGMSCGEMLILEHNFRKPGYKFKDSEGKFSSCVLRSECIIFKKDTEPKIDKKYSEKTDAESQKLIKKILNIFRKN